MAEGWLQVAQEALKVPGILVEIYGDLARPGVKQVGQALETVLGLGNTILLPIKMANEKSRLIFEKNMERYRAEMEKVAEDHVARAVPEIGVPALDKLTYVMDDQLADLYATLLASASNIEKLHYAHPSFVHIINCLSSDEAQFLRHFSKSNTMPMVTVRAMAKEEKNYKKIGSPLVPLECVKKLAFPENIGVYISNLNGLGLVTRFDENSLTDKAMYVSIENSHQKENSQRFLDEFPDRTISYKRGALELSPLGIQFLSACLREWRLSS